MTGHERVDGWRNRRVFTLGVVVATIAGAFALMGPSSADVTAVTGSAYGYSLNVSLFGAAQPPIGPTPIVTLPPGGSAVPVTDSAPTGSAKQGPATFFSSGPITVSTEGTPGPTGSVTSSTSIMTVNTSGQEAFTADSIASTCTASEAGVSGSTTVTNGTLVTDSGDDAAGDVHPPVQVAVPTNPAPNTAFEGHIHVNGSQDNFRYVFNEQVTNPDGSITVNAAHEYILGPTAVGDLILGQSVCAVTAVSVSTTTTLPSTTTTLPSTTTTTRPSTTTTLPSTTTTRVPPIGPSCDGRAATIVGTSGNDVLIGTAGPDVIAGRGGRDVIVGLGGDDVICGGSGSDTIDGGAGNDTIRGGGDNDRIIGGTGNDDLQGNAGNDIIVDTRGDDHLNGGPGTDTCVDRSGTDTFVSCERQISAHAIR